jgi:hypothetical protein
MDPADLEHLRDDPWISFLLGKNPGYPLKTIKAEQQHITNRIERMRNDASTREMRQSDTPQRFNPVNAGTLVNLTTGGNNPDIAGNSLHCRVRYFDPAKQRAGLPNDVAALVEKITKEGIELTLVNTNAEESRRVILQAGAYGEHRFRKVTLGTDSSSIDDKHFSVQLAPGAGSKIVLGMDYYKNNPSLAHPW